MPLHENPGSPPFQSYKPPFTGTNSLSAQSSILDIRPHGWSDWTTFSTEPIPNRIPDASSSSSSVQQVASSTSDTTACIGVMGLNFCTGLSAASSSTWASVVTVPPESSLKPTGGSSGQDETSITTSPLLSVTSYNPALSSSLWPSSPPASGVPTTTFHTVSSPSNFPSQTITTDIVPSSNQSTSSQLQPTGSSPTSTASRNTQSEASRSGPIAVYIILAVFVTFGIVCALVTNRRIVSWTQAAIRKRSERNEARRKAEQ
jgi:hypothetical protein